LIFEVADKEKRESVMIKIVGEWGAWSERIDWRHWKMAWSLAVKMEAE